MQGLTAIVGKASAGAAEHMKIARVPNIPSVLKEHLRMRAFGSTARQPAAAVDLWSTDFTGLCAIVIGSEGDGMGRLVRESCDFIVSIPMAGQDKLTERFRRRLNNHVRSPAPAQRLTEGYL